jgi:hypothetical protein
MKTRHLRWVRLGVLAAGLLLIASPALVSPAHAQQTKTKIIPLVADDFGFGDTRPLWRWRGSRHADAEHRPAVERHLHE